jgi:hypothetical protein
MQGRAEGAAGYEDNRRPLLALLAVMEAMGDA